MDKAQSDQAPRLIRREDYTPPEYRIDSVDLKFDLDGTETRVTARSRFRRARDERVEDLVLDGGELALLTLRMDNRDLIAGVDFTVDDRGLVLHEPPAQFTLETVTRIHPRDNASLEGLYLSNGVFCTQCEAEGFRRITYFLDRPDVMAVYTTTLIADRDLYPVLLSNGNLIDSGELEEGRHYATWHDPYPKPSYLFALVAGKLAHIEDHYTTASGRPVLLRIYSEPHNSDHLDHAMVSLKKAMRWDEQRFGLEYDLDVYMIVAVEDFNMGAMENKGLNVFNTRYVLAKPETATDDDYLGIESVIAHEYFHNWTGNRVTCRDWFQLSLKEGLTVFRDQEFSADHGLRAVKRIQDVRVLRTVQFAEDAGPMAHPVRPDAYMEINNFYTVTVYEKGAEVVRMYQTLLGREGFHRGMDLYFRRHDGQAVTCDDFLAAMASANDENLDQFALWYSQAGTPEVTVRGEYDASNRRYTLHCSQTCAPTPGQPDKQPLLIPLAVGLIGADGGDIPLRLAGEPHARGETRTLRLAAAEQQFVFEDVPAEPVPSLLRGFSAPVRLRHEASDDVLSFRLAHDSDPFNRWDAGQTLFLRTLMAMITTMQAGSEPGLPAVLADSLGEALTRVTDRALLAEILTLPSESYIADQMDTVDVDAVHRARESMRRVLAEALAPRLRAHYEALSGDGPYGVDAESVGRRRLRNRCLDYLMQLDDPDMVQLCLAQFREARNMTDEIAAVGLLANHPGEEREEVLDRFFQRWRHEPLVVDKWFMLQATSRLPGTLERVQGLLEHPAFNLRNPNKVRALVGAFGQGNPVHFHRADGAGYRFVAAQVLELDAFNPMIAARLAGVFTRWRRHDAQRAELMRLELERIRERDGLSPDLFEVVSKSLAEH